MRRRTWPIGLTGLALALVAACSKPSPTAANGPVAPPVSPSASDVVIIPGPVPTPTPSRPRSTSTVKPKPKVTLTKKAVAAVDAGSAGATAGPTPPADGVPTSGNGTFTVSAGGTDVVGTGTTLVTYETQVENGITWGDNPVWTPDMFASTVDAILADPRGWTASAAHPITDAKQHQNNASYSFQRVSSGTFAVRILLATPDTTDKLCGSVGLTTQGVYSCRYGSTEVINLRRWLKGAPGFAMNLDGYHTMVVNHEMGHFIGFDHMLCPAAGQPAPVMQEETIDLAGCTPNAYPFAADGTFITGPWAAS
jgi:uncharacterized protein DUF3152